MFNYFKSFWTAETEFSGLARNAPYLKGIKITELFAQRPVQVMNVTENVIQDKIKALKPTIINAVKPLPQKTDIREEFDSMFSNGDFKQYFANLKLKKAQRKNNKLTENTTPDLQENNVGSSLTTCEDKIVESETETVPSNLQENNISSTLIVCEDKMGDSENFPSNLQENNVNFILPICEDETLKSENIIETSFIEI